jgi:hypothetical protein
MILATSETETGGLRFEASGGKNYMTLYQRQTRPAVPSTQKVEVGELWFKASTDKSTAPYMKNE